MADPIERAYESELSYIRNMGVEFARERPKIAERLLLNRDTGTSVDPHVERLIEAFAFLAARIRMKLDDEFPELTEALLETLYPHYLAPIPSMGIVEFEVDSDRGNLPEGHRVDRGSRMLSQEFEGVSCQYRTTAETMLWPLTVAQARYQTAPFGKDVIVPARSAQAKAMIRLELEVGGGASLVELQLDSLRLFLAGDAPVTNSLYELIFNHATSIQLRAGASTLQEPLVLLPDRLQPVGFGIDEGLLPYGGRSFLGYRLLTEYFCFPQKFQFFEITGLDAVRRGGFDKRLEILIFLNRSIPRLESLVRAETFRLGCVPVVNLFDQATDPVPLSRARTDNHVIPDVRHHWAMEVYSIDSVESTNVDTQQTVEYQPFYAFKHGTNADANTAYWCQSRRPSMRKDDTGTEVYLTLVDLNFNPAEPPADVLMVQATCTNRNLPALLRERGVEDFRFQLQAQAPVQRIVSVVPPTIPLRLPQEELRWRLISHLSLNHLSITDPEDGADALREILKLYDYASTRATQQHIDGITSVTSRRAVAPIMDKMAQGFCRGIELTIEFDDDKFAGGGPYLFASVLERFLGMYATINSATRLVARSRQREGYWKRWPFRSGEKTLL